MKIGICGDQSTFALAKQNIFSYAEPSIQLYRNKDSETLKTMRKETEMTGITIDGFNNFFSGDISIYEDSIDKLKEYSIKNFEIASYFGSEYLVIGSGRSRAIKDGMNKEECEDKFTDIISSLADIAKKYNLKLIIEPLNYKETNFINTLDDGISICRKINHTNVGFLVDFFHFFINGESLREFDKLKPGELSHIHLARPNVDRDAPISEDLPIISSWANKLKEIGYDGRVSLECLWKYGFENSVKSASEVLKTFL